MIDMRAVVGGKWSRSLAGSRAKGVLEYTERVLTLLAICNVDGAKNGRASALN